MEKNQLIPNLQGVYIGKLMTDFEMYLNSQFTEVTVNKHIRKKCNSVKKANVTDQSTLSKFYEPITTPHKTVIGSTKDQFGIVSPIKIPTSIENTNRLHRTPKKTAIPNKSFMVKTTLPFSRDISIDDEDVKSIDKLNHEIRMLLVKLTHGDMTHYPV